MRKIAGAWRLLVQGGAGSLVHVTSHPHTSVSEAAGAQLMGPRSVPEAGSPAGRSPAFHITAVDISSMSTVRTLSSMSTVRTWFTVSESFSHSECAENQVPCVIVAAFPYLSNSKLLRKIASILIISCSFHLLP